MEKIIIMVNKPIDKERLFYIADCWVEFVEQDLGMKPSDLLMILPG